MNPRNFYEIDLPENVAVRKVSRFLLNFPTLFYNNPKNNNRYEKVLYTNGRVIDLKPFSDLTIYKYPCCAMTENTIINFKIKRDSLLENFGFNFFYSPILKPISKDYDFNLPAKLKAGKEYTLQVNSGINYVPKDSLENPMFIKKSLFGYTNGETHIISYASITDKKGIQWIYCKIPKESVLLTDKKIEYPLLVWVKLRDCH